MRAYIVSNEFSLLIFYKKFLKNARESFSYTAVGRLASEA
jgi:hypothetical protein